jgi:hypothetical protein
MALDCGAISSLSPLRVSLFITTVRFRHYGLRRSVYSIDDDDDGSTEAVIQGMIEAAQRMIRVINKSTEEEEKRRCTWGSKSKISLILPHFRRDSSYIYMSEDPMDTAS